MNLILNEVPNSTRKQTTDNAIIEDVAYWRCKQEEKGSERDGLENVI